MVVPSQDLHLTFLTALRNPCHVLSVSGAEFHFAVNNTTLPIFFAASLASLSASAIQAQRSYLDEALEPSSRSKAAYYVEDKGTDAAGHLARIFTMDGVLKAEGHYADAELHIPDGTFTFYFPDGRVESSGDYEKGLKKGVWLRYDKWGRELAEKVYETKTSENIVFTMAQTMPEYPGGEKAMVRYLRDKVGKTHGDVTASFVVEKDGLLSDVKIIGAEDQKLADELVDVIGNLPRFQAGMQDGQPVRVQMRVPLK